MRTAGSLGRLIGTSVLAVGCLLAPTRGAEQVNVRTDAVQVEILGVRGEVKIRRSATPESDEARKGKKLYPGDRLEVGPNGKAWIRDGNRTILTLGPGSTVVRKGGTAFELLQGVLHFFRRDKLGQLEFKTPAVAGIAKGTEFVLRVEGNGTTRLDLIEGEAELRGRIGVVQLIGGEAAVAQPNEPPTKVPVLSLGRAIQWFLYYPGILDPNDLEWVTRERSRFEKSIGAYFRGDISSALSDLPSSDPLDLAAAKVYRAVLWLAAGRVEEADALLSGVGESPDSEQYATKAAKALQNVVRLVRKENAATTMNVFGESLLTTELLALSYLEQSRTNLDRALEHAQKAVEKSPQFGFGWVRVAELEFSFGRIKAAKAAVTRSLEFAPQNAQAIALQGFLLAADNRTTSALEWFAHAIQLDPGLANAWLGSGLCKIRRGDAEAGLDDLEIAAAVEPNRSLLRSYLGKGFSQVGDLEHAERELLLAKASDPLDPTPWLYSALLAQQEGRINEAIRDLEKSQQLGDERQVYRSRLLLDQDRAVRGANLASVYQDAGMDEVAVREATRAVNADYANFSGHQFLANSYNALRDPRQVNLRYDTAWLNEYLLANLLAPVGAGSLSPFVTQQEYGKLLERDRLGFSSRTDYLSDGDWTQNAVQYGTHGNMSYAAEVTYRSWHGYRTNNSLEQLATTLRYKQQLTPQDSVYFQGIYYDASAGDVQEHYSAEEIDPSLLIKETQEPVLLLGYNHEWAPGSHTLALVGRMDDTLDVTSIHAPTYYSIPTALGGTRIEPATFKLRYQSVLEIYSGELQQIFQRPHHTLIVGGRAQGGRINTSSMLSDGDLDRGVEPITADASSLQRLSAYAYSYWQPAESLTLEGGISYDHLDYPANHRLSPISGEQEHQDLLAPKAGLIWTPLPSTTVRGAFIKSLGGVSLEQTYRLEPTQVAGFNQAYRSLIPEAEAGSVSGEEFETWGLSLEKKIGIGTYLGASFEVLRGKVSRTVGVIDMVPTSPPLPASPGQAGSTREDLDHEERNVTVTIDQLIGTEWSVGARYTFSEADLRQKFPDWIAANAATTGDVTLRYHHQAILNRPSLFTVYNHPSGLFGRLESLWSWQRNSGYSDSRQGDEFWHLNLYAGYRWPQRRAEIMLGLLNVTDQDFRHNPLNLTPQEAHHRTFLASFRFSF